MKTLSMQRPLPSIEIRVSTRFRRSVQVKDVNCEPWTLNAARLLAPLNPGITFIYISGMGTDIAGKEHWAQVKGRAEADLAALPFKAVHSLRPAAIVPMHGEQSQTRAYRLFYRYAGWALRPLVRLSGGYIMASDELARAMLTLLRHPHANKVLEAKDIRNLRP